jgi:hypothetical protein
MWLCAVCGPGAEEKEGAARDDVVCVAERLEVQQQALVDLEASILEAQKEVGSSVVVMMRAM